LIRPSFPLSRNFRFPPFSDAPAGCEVPETGRRPWHRKADL